MRLISNWYFKIQLKIITNDFTVYVLLGMIN